VFCQPFRHATAGRWPSADLRLTRRPGRVTEAAAAALAACQQAMEGQDDAGLRAVAEALRAAAGIAAESLPRRGRRGGPR